MASTHRQASSHAHESVGQPAWTTATVDVSSGKAVLRQPRLTRHSHLSLDAPPSQWDVLTSTADRSTTGYFPVFLLRV